MEYKLILEIIIIRHNITITELLIFNMFIKTTSNNSKQMSFDGGLEMTGTLQVSRTNTFHWVLKMLF